MPPARQSARSPAPRAAWLAAALLALAGCAGESEPPVEFPQYLGAERDGTVRGVRLARDWSERPPLEIWRQPVGLGYSGFAVSAGIAVTQEQWGGREMVVGRDLATGEILWKVRDSVRYESTLAGVGPRATPTIADGRVFTLGATALLSSIDLATGERGWRRKVLQDMRTANLEWGTSCSPLVVDDLVVVSVGGPRKPHLAAYDRDTGEPVWTAGRERSSYSSPLVTTLAGVRQIVSFNRGSVSGHSPETGSVLWSYPWSSSQPNVSQPIPLVPDRLLVASGYDVGVRMLRFARSAGGELEVEPLWSSRELKPKHTNLVQHEGFIYGLDNGILACLDPATGERRWKGGRYGHGQILLAGGLLIVQTERGEVVLVEANPDEHRELGRLAVLEGRTWNTPALAGPYLLVRNEKEAVCLRLPLVGER